MHGMGILSRLLCKDLPQEKHFCGDCPRKSVCHFVSHLLDPLLPVSCMYPLFSQAILCSRTVFLVTPPLEPLRRGHSEVLLSPTTVNVAGDNRTTVGGILSWKHSTVSIVLGCRTARGKPFSLRLCILDEGKTGLDVPAIASN